MEDQIKKAESTKSKCGEITKIIGITGLVIGTFIGIHNLIFKVNRFSEVTFLVFGGAALSSLGNNATSNKRTAELMAILVRSKNSASQLPGDLLVSKKSDEDTRKYLNRI